MTARRRVRPMPSFNGQELQQQHFLSLAQAAFFCGYTQQEFKDPIRAFYKAVLRAGIPRSYASKRTLRFKRVDLERFLSGREGVAHGR